jgi:hypothetical protein
VHPALAKDADLVALLIHDLGIAVERAIKKHQKALIDMQFLHERLADIATDLVLATAVLSRTTSEIERAGSDAAARYETDCARAFIAMAHRRVRRNLRGIARNQDSRLATIAKWALSDGELAPEAPWR